MRSDKRIALRDRRLAKAIRKIIIRIEELEHKITYVDEKNPRKGGDIQRGDPDAVLKDVKALINYLTGEELDLQKIEKDSAILYYDLIKGISDIERQLEDIQRRKGTQELSGEIQKLQELSHNIQGMIINAKREARLAMHDRERMMRFWTGIMGAEQVAINIKNTEIELRKMEGKVKAIEASIRDHADVISLVKKDVQEFLKVAGIIAKDISEEEHNDMILTFYSIHKLEAIAQILTKLKEEGFDPASQQMLEGQYFRAKALMEEVSREAFRLQRCEVGLARKAA